MEHTDLQNKVIEEAQKRLEKYDWYKGVCLDYLKQDKEIKENFDEAVKVLVLSTVYGDCPNFFFYRHVIKEYLTNIL